MTIQREPAAPAAAAAALPTVTTTAAATPAATSAAGIPTQSASGQYILPNGKPIDAEALGLAPITTSAPGGFGCRLPQVVELISERGTYGMERLVVNFGGAAGLAAKLKSDLIRGISGSKEDIEERIRVFGCNSTPDVTPKTLWQLMWEALQDPILIVLMIAATISLVLGATVDDHPDVGEFFLCE